jgi:hypothetical protein
VLEVFRRLGSVQFDPLAVAGRNHPESRRRWGYDVLPILFRFAGARQLAWRRTRRRAAAVPAPP